MTVSSVSSGFSASAGRPSRDILVRNCFSRLSEKFTRITLKEGRYRTPGQTSSAPKPSVFISCDLLLEAAQDSKVEQLLQDKLNKIPDLQKVLEEKFSVHGRKLLESGFVVDKKGNLICKGRGEVDGKEESFSVTVGKISEKFADFGSRLSSRFEVQAFRLLNLYA